MSLVIPAQTDSPFAQLKLRGCIWDYEATRLIIMANYNVGAFYVGGAFSVL